jgi:hypothetical protein
MTAEITEDVYGVPMQAREGTKGRTLFVFCSCHDLQSLEL